MATREKHPRRRTDLFVAPAIALVLLFSWLIPFRLWTLLAVAAACLLLFVLSLVLNRPSGRKMLSRPSVIAALTMWSLSVFLLAYGIVALHQPTSIETNGSNHIGHVGVLALLATSMGIAGGEVGVHLSEGARVVAHVQLLVVVGAVAGVGGQIVKRLSTEDEGIGDEPPSDPILDLYARVFARLRAASVLDELYERHPELERWQDRDDLARRLRTLPHPAHATVYEALYVYRRIVSGDLEFTYGLPFEGRTLGETLSPLI